MFEIVIYSLDYFENVFLYVTLENLSGWLTVTKNVFLWQGSMENISLGFSKMTDSRVRLVK